MSNKRFIIEGTWTGYTSSQERVVHRTVYEGGRKKLRAWAERTHAIRYTDGTSLILTVRDCLPRERVQQIHGYDELINSCFHYDVSSVEDAHQAKVAWQAECAARRAAESAAKVSP